MPGAGGRVQPNFFGTPGADDHAFPLYSLQGCPAAAVAHPRVFEAADRDPSLIDRGALNFVVVGGGATGVETAGALADMINWTMTVEYRDLAVKAARVHIVDIGDRCSGPFSKRAHEYVAKVLTRKGVELHLGTKVTEVDSRARDARRRGADRDTVRGLGRRHRRPRASRPRPACPKDTAAAWTCCPI